MFRRLIPVLALVLVALAPSAQADEPFTVVFETNQCSQGTYAIYITNNTGQADYVRWSDSAHPNQYTRHPVSEDGAYMVKPVEGFGETHTIRQEGTDQWPDENDWSHSFVVSC